ncbi:MAG TPA: polyhydroxyalkanoate synthesis regulator DNA-binding domain-containing protein [Anaerolineales bacterium]
MRLIKRYPNRKLYDTADKCYVTLDDLAALICAGHEIQVLDNTCGEDLTAITLTQIIFEKEKRQGDFLPKSVLTGLIQAGGDTLSTLRRNLASPLDLLSQIDREIERRLRDLAGRGELAEEDAWRLLEKLSGPCDESWLNASLEDEVLQQAIARRGIPTREDFQVLTKQVESLAAKIDQVQAQSSSRRFLDLWEVQKE